MVTISGGQSGPAAPMSSETLELAFARSVLATLADRSPAHRLQAAEALAVLSDVTPPLPPVAGLLDPGLATEEEAAVALEAAAGAAVDVREAARIAAAAEGLRRPLAQ
jgi:hypothetical protein